MNELLEVANQQKVRMSVHYIHSTDPSGFVQSCDIADDWVGSKEVL